MICCTMTMLFLGMKLFHAGSPTFPFSAIETVFMHYISSSTFLSTVLSRLRYSL